MPDTGFKEAMRANPHDETSRLVYADWLDEHGRPRAAARLRWWIEAQKHITPTSGSAVRGPEATDTLERRMPEWVARLNQVRGARKILTGTPAGEHPSVQDALHSAELHAIGADDDFVLARARATTAAHALRTSGIPLANIVHRSIMPGVLAADSRHVIDHPAAMAAAYRAAHLHMPTLMDNAALHTNDHETQLLRDYMRHSPPPDTGVSGPEPPMRFSLKDWIKRLAGGKTSASGPTDGIVHSAASHPEGAQNERVALHTALRQLSPEHAKIKADKYLSHVAALVRDNADSPVVKAYTDAARAHPTDATKMVPFLKPLLLAANIRQVQAGTDSRFVTPTYGTVPAPAAHPVVESSAPEAPAVPAPPVDLSDVPEPPKESRHQAVIRMIKAGAPKEDIFRHLMDVHGAPHLKAAQASYRAALARAHALLQNRPTKLAAWTSGAIRPEHVLGTTAARDPYTQQSLGFRPQIEGTALAVHLRQIAKEHSDLAPAAEAALTGRAYGAGAKQDDPFAFIGQKLRQRRSPLAGLHDWDNLNEHMIHDAAVQHAVKGLVLRGAHEPDSFKYWERVRNADKSKNASAFWQRLEAALGGKHGDQNAIRASIARIADRALDREYLSTINTEGVKANPGWNEPYGVRK